MQKVIFSPKPVPPGIEVPLVYSVVPSPVPELMACPLLGRGASSVSGWSACDRRDVRATSAEREPELVPLVANRVAGRSRCLALADLDVNAKERPHDRAVPIGASMPAE